MALLAAASSALVHHTSRSQAAAVAGPFRPDASGPSASLVTATRDSSQLPVISPQVQLLENPIAAPAASALPPTVAGLQSSASVTSPAVPRPPAVNTPAFSGASPSAAAEAPPALPPAIPPAVAAALPVLAAPPPAPEVASKGRLPRAQALPEAPSSAGASDPQAGASGGTPSAQTQAQTQTGATQASQFVEHTITPGETISGIANAYGVSLASVMASNPGLGDFDLITPGQTLRVPSTNGLLYSVQDGDTLSSISRRYGIPTDDVMKLAANNLQNADAITVGQTLLLPGDIKPPPVPAPVVKPLIVASATAPPAPPSDATAAGVPAPAPSQNASPPPPPPPPASPTAVVARFIWPVQGPITQGFGVPELGVGSPHTGVDIGLYGRDGTPIAAASAGKVIFSGGDACCGFGYYVILQHAGGFTTLYGHLSRRAVSVGDTVAQGQTVGYAGSTGFSTGTHLHFEMHLNGDLVNPLRYLP